MEVQAAAGGYMGEFRDALERRGLRRLTIYNRLFVVRSWSEYLDKQGRTLNTGTTADVENWLDPALLSPRTRYARISHLHMFYVWAMRTGRVDHDPTSLVERPRLDRRLPRPARSATINAAYEQADPVMRVALSLMADAGLRCMEVAGLDWDDVDLVAGVVYVAGKGGRDRVVGMPARLRVSLAALDGSSGPVLGRRYAAHRVSQLVNEYLHSCGTQATAHQLRHLYATRLYSATGGNLLAVQHALGHASVTSTQVYAELDPGVAVAAAQLLD